MTPNSYEFCILTGKKPSENLKERIKDHNWHETTYSKSKAPFELAWFCGFKDKKKALAFEKYLKQGSGFAFARKRLV